VRFEVPTPSAFEAYVREQQDDKDRNAKLPTMWTIAEERTILVNPAEIKKLRLKGQNIEAKVRVHALIFHELTRLLGLDDARLRLSKRYPEVALKTLRR